MAPSGLALIPFGPEHFTALAGWFPTEAALVQWGGIHVRFPLDERQMQAWVDDTSGDPPRRRCWMARQDSDLVGHAQLAIDRRNGVGLVGRFGIAPAHRGRGLATPLMHLVLEQAFADPGIERVELNVYTFNAAAIAAYDRAGFVREGVRRSSVAVGGARWDTAMMGILRPEYEAARTAA